MKKVTLLTSTAIPAGDVTAMTTGLNNAVAGLTVGSKVIYEIIQQDDAPSLEAYASVGATLIDIEPQANEGFCRALYYAAVSAGVPQDVAYAAYLVCLAT